MNTGAVRHLGDPLEEGEGVAAVATARPNAEKDTNHVNRVKDVNDVRGNPKSEGNVGVKPNNLFNYKKISY